MDFSITEIASYGGGGTIVVGLFTKYVIPLFNKLLKSQTEIAKIKAKSHGKSNDELIAVLTSRIEKLEESENRLQEKVIRLEVSLATLKERYAEKTVLRSGKRKPKSK